jgi:hypothetical protein
MNTGPSACCVSLVGRYLFDTVHEVQSPPKGCTVLVTGWCLKLWVCSDVCVPEVGRRTSWPSVPPASHSDSTASGSATSSVTSSDSPASSASSLAASVRAFSTRLTMYPSSQVAKASRSTPPSRV